MSILGTVLTAPVLGPIKGLLWLARSIEEHANAELYDEEKIRGELAELELALELKQIDLRRIRRARRAVAEATERDPESPK